MAGDRRTIAEIVGWTCLVVNLGLVALGLVHGFYAITVLASGMAVAIAVWLACAPTAARVLDAMADDAEIRRAMSTLARSVMEREIGQGGGQVNIKGVVAERRH